VPFDRVRAPGRRRRQQHDVVAGANAQSRREPDAEDEAVRIIARKVLAVRNVQIAVDQRLHVRVDAFPYERESRLPRLMRPLKPTLGATADHARASASAAISGERSGSKYRNGSEAPFSIYPGLTTLMCPIPFWIAASAVAQNTTR